MSVGTESTSDPTRIVLVAGPVKASDKLGHHDYAAGCRTLAELLSSAAGVEPIIAMDGWPADESVLQNAASLVFYDKGGGRQAFLAAPNRLAILERAARAGAGIVMIHQTLGFPAAHVEFGKGLLGGVYAPGASSRGHWKSEHQSFPVHPVTRGVEPWKILDGWLNRIAFSDGLRGVVPLLWSGKRFAGSPDGGDDDIVAWAYERPGRGRSFAFTGLDAHSAWSHAGLRRLIVNGILWSAGVEVPETGFPVDIDEAVLRTYLTPRRSRLTILPRKLWRRWTASPRW